MFGVACQWRSLRSLWQYVSCLLDMPHDSDKLTLCVEEVLDGNWAAFLLVVDGGLAECSFRRCAHVVLILLAECLNMLVDVGMFLQLVLATLSWYHEWQGY